ncbi:MAG TPA: hypothetical protein VNM72_11525 [Blastocatellia bacterium]|nr:hypothetical protein [Blastocatellia bacterium]
MIREITCKAVVALSSLLVLGTGICVISSAQRTKKDNMVEMGQAYRAIHNKVFTGAVEAKFTDQDFQEISANYAALARLAEEYAKLETNQDLATISRNLARDSQQIKAYADRKDPLMMVNVFSRVMSYCAECHYQTRWPATPAK